MFLKDELAGLIDELSLSADVKISDMPDIDLYIEQLTSLIDGKLSGHKREKNDKILTKTM